MWANNPFSYLSLLSKKYLGNNWNIFVGQCHSAAVPQWSTTVYSIKVDTAVLLQKWWYSKQPKNVEKIDYLRKKICHSRPIKKARSGHTDKQMLAW